MRIEDVQRIYATHSVKDADGKCAECGYGAPCEKQRLAEEVVKARREAERLRESNRLLNGQRHIDRARAERVEAAIARVEHACDLSEWLGAEADYHYGEWTAGRYQGYPFSNTGKIMRPREIAMIREAIKGES